MADKQTKYFVLTTVVAVLIYFLSRPKKVVDNANVDTTVPDQYINDPVLAGYNPNSGFANTALTDPNFNINIANQGLSYLDEKYIPLFGFVGIAQDRVLH